MNEKDVLDLASNMAVINNDGENKAQGVLFDKFKDENGEIVNNAFFYGRAKESDNKAFITMISNFETTENLGDHNFFNFMKNKYTSNTLECDANQLSNIFAGLEFNARMQLPLNRILNFLGTRLPDFSQMKRTRLIITPEAGYLEKGEHICLFDENGVFKDPRITRPFIIDKCSKIGPKDIKLGRPYITEIVNEDSEYRYVTVVREYFKGIRIAIKSSVKTCGYFPESDAELYDFRYAYDPNDILTIPLGGDIPDFAPIHVDTVLFNDCLKLYISFKYIDLFIQTGKNFYTPLLLRGVQQDETYPLINCLIAPLDQQVRGGVR